MKKESCISPIYEPNNIKIDNCSEKKLISKHTTSLSSTKFDKNINLDISSSLYPFIPQALEGVKIILEDEIEVQLKPKNSNCKYYYTGIDKNGQCYLMLTINFTNNKSISTNNDSNIKEYLLDLEEKTKSRTVLYYYGIYYDHLSTSHYLTFEHPSSDYEIFKQTVYVDLKNSEKILFLKEIFKTFIFLTENKIVYPLIKNPNFYFVKQIKSKFYYFKFLYLGKLISFTKDSSNTINLLDVLDFYRASLIEQMETLRINFNIHIQLEYTESQFNLLDINLIKSYYVYEFAKIVLNSYFKIAISDEEMSKLKYIPKEIPIDIKTFILLNIKTKCEGSLLQNNKIENLSQDPLRVFDNFLIKFSNIIDIEELDVVENLNEHMEENSSKLEKSAIIPNGSHYNLRTKAFKLSDDKSSQSDSISNRFLKTKRNRSEYFNELNNTISNPSQDNLCKKNENKSQIEVIDLVSEEENIVQSNLIKETRLHRINPTKEEIIILDTNSSLTSLNRSHSSISPDDCSNIFLLNKSRCSVNKHTENSKPKSFSPPSFRIIINNESLQDIFLENLEKEDINKELNTFNRILVDKDTFMFREKTNFMLKSFPRLSDEINNYYFKPLSEELLKNAIPSKDLPKIKQKTKISHLNSPKKIINNINKHDNESKNNLNININMTNVIFSTDINNYDGSELIINKLNKNLLNSFNKIQNKFCNKIQLNNKLRMIWTNQILPDCEEIKRCWPYDTVQRYYDDIALKFLLLCEYDVFKSIKDIECCSDFFTKFCYAHNLIEESGLTTKKKKSVSNSYRKNRSKWRKQAFPK